MELKMVRMNDINVILEGLSVEDHDDVKKAIIND